MFEVFEYLDWNGRSPYADWFDSLSAPAAAKVAVAVTRIAQGNLSNVKGVGSGVFECRLDFGPGYRIYLAKDGERLVILLGGGTKNASKKTLMAQSRDGRTTRRERNSGATMPLTRDFRETIQARVRRDRAFRKELLREAMETFLSGDVETGKSVLRDYINATVGFNHLAEATHHPPKSLMRMLGPSGNPQARNLFEIVEYLQKKEGIRFRLRAAAAGG